MNKTEINHLVKELESYKYSDLSDESAVDDIMGILSDLIDAGVTPLRKEYKLLLKLRMKLRREDADIAFSNSQLDGYTRIARRFIK